MAQVPLAVPYEIAEYREFGTIGDRTAMVVVELPTASSKLRRYGPWMRSKGGGIILKKMAPSAAIEWWVYRGTIARKHIVGFDWTDAHCNEGEEHIKAVVDATIAKMEAA
jgi:hypothetical protein